MTKTELLLAIKERLSDLYGERFRGLVLYGSAARGDDGPDSDIDLLCLLEGPVSIWEELGRTIEATRDLELDGEVYRSVEIMPVDIEDYREGEFGFLLNVRREGVAV